METASFLPNSSLLDKEEGISRQTAGYVPSEWGDYFIKHHSSPSSTIQKSEDWIRERVAQLVRQVKTLLKETRCNDLKSLERIDALQRLGVGYHFEEEIDTSLKLIHDSGNIADSDLHTVALRFRLLRQQGYYVKSDVFNKFKVDGGEFNKHLAGDVRGLLSLSEACFWATHEDGILSEALSFARRHLAEACGLGSAMDSLVTHALELPLHRRIPRLEARYYIEVYEQDEERRNDTILELSKLDFHLLQLLHYQEARSISIWWKGLGLQGKFDFARDRIVECYFWLVSVYFEPKYSAARIIATKVIQLLSTTDDIYDAYGTFDELQSLTGIIERWEVEAADQLNYCMKIHFQNINKTFQEFEDELSSYGKSYRVHYLKEILKVTAKAWLVETKWREEGYIPTLEEHLKITSVTSCYNLVSCATLVGMDDLATKEAFDWMLSFPKFTHYASVISRLRDDITSHELEQKRIHVASAVQCYMKEHNCELEKACEQLLEMVEDEWKSLNHEYLIMSATFPRDILMRVINLSRFMESIYGIQDMYTHSSHIKEYISQLLIEQVSF